MFLYFPGRFSFFFYVILTYLQALIVHEFSAKVNLKKKED